MQKYFFVFLLTACIMTVIPSCGTAGRTRAEAVESLAERGDTASLAPYYLFSGMAEIRQTRGLFYAASLTSAEARFEEMTSVAEFSADDEKAVRKSLIYAETLASYLRAIKSLCSDSRWKTPGTDLRGIGNRIDSVIARYNKTGFSEEEIPTGYARLGGRVSGFIAEAVMKGVQAKNIRKIIPAGDTLVAASCDSLISILRSPEMDSLIDNEKDGLKQDYKAYLSRMELMGTFPPIEYDRLYMETLIKADGLKQARNKCVSALRSIKNAHAKIAASLTSRADAEEILTEAHAELAGLARIASDLYKLLKED